MTLKGSKPTPVKLDGSALVVAIGGGIPSKCTYALADGKLKITYDEPKQKPVTWAVWFDDTNKIMHTPKETLTATE